MSEIVHTFACEHDDVPCRAYIVMGHDGSITRCIYCDDCAELAAIDWNGETASCQPICIDEPYDRDGTSGRACTRCNTAWPASERDGLPHHHNDGCPAIVEVL